MSDKKTEENSLCAEKCPACGSRNISRAEKDYKEDYPFWIFFLTAILAFAAAAALFIFLQLHPVIIILLLVALVTRMLEKKARGRPVKKRQEYICLECRHRYSITCSYTNNQASR